MNSARAVLATVAAATITFASVSFSVSLLIMQQASSQYSPRVVHGLTRDPFFRRVIALVVGTFTYCLVAVQRVRGPLEEGGEATTRDFAVALGVVLGVGAVLAVVAAINHTSREMDISYLLSDLVEQATAAGPTDQLDHLDVEPLYSEVALPVVPMSVVRFDRDGWIRRVDRAALLGLAEPGGIVTVEAEGGRYAVRGSRLCSIWPEVATENGERVSAEARRAVQLGPTRTLDDDASYGIRQVVDVALRALSAGVNDPTTAADAIFHLCTVLVHVLTSPPAPRAYRGPEGQLLVTPEAMTDDDVADLAFGELRAAAATYPRVCVYLLEAMSLVIDAVAASGAAASRAAPLHRQAELLVSAADATIAHSHDRVVVRAAFDKRFPPNDAFTDEAPGGRHRGRGGDGGA